MMTLLTTLLFTGSAAADRTEREDRNRVEDTLREWTRATDARDAQAVSAIFQTSAVQHVQLGDKALALTTEVYLGMIRDGKIGGGTTALQIHGIEVHEGLATALTTRTGAEMVMRDAVVLERTDTGWRIASAAVHATPR